jgi:hypothetical protein
MMQTYTFGDADRAPLGAGTAIRFPTYYNHEGIIAYTHGGQQVLLEKSKKYKVPRIGDPEEYRGFPYVISRAPSSPAHAMSILQRACAEIDAGKPWTIFDNCQDFVSRAYSEKNGSETRNLAFGLATVVGVVIAIL